MPHCHTFSCPQFLFGRNMAYKNTSEREMLKTRLFSQEDMKLLLGSSKCRGCICLHKTRYHVNDSELLDSTRSTFKICMKGMWTRADMQGHIFHSFVTRAADFPKRKYYPTFRLYIGFYCGDAMAGRLPCFCYLRRPKGPIMPSHFLKYHFRVTWQ